MMDLVARVATWLIMMTSSNGNIFRVTGPLCGEFTGPGEFPTQRPVTRSFDVYFDLRPNKRLSKQSWSWWFETLSWSLWRHHNDVYRSVILLKKNSMPKFALALVFDIVLQCQKQISIALPIHYCNYMKVIHIRHPFTVLEYSCHKFRCVYVILNIFF